MRALNVNQKLMFSYTLLIIITVLTIGVTISIIFSGQLIESSKRELDLRISLISREIEDQLLKVMKITEEVSGNEELLHRLNLEEKGGERGRLIKDIRRAVVSTEKRSPLISRIVLINHNLEVLDPVYSRPLYSSAILNDDDFLEFLQKRYFYYFAKPGTFPIDVKKNPRGSTSDSIGDGNLTIVLYQRLFDSNYWLMGYQLSVLNKNMLFSSIWSNNRDQLFSGINIFNERNELLFRNGLTFPVKKISEKIDFSKLGGDATITTTINSVKCLVLIRLLPSVNWFVTGIIPYSTIFRNLRIALQWVFLIGVIFTIIAILVSYSIARTITKPLLKITEAMHSYEKTGNLATIDVKASGELKYLANVYNRLVTQINEFIENIYREQEEKRKAELRSLQYELNYLQAQINPHFIHNTLNAIGYQAEREGNRIVYESLKSFNILLRAAISGTDALVSIREEIELVKNFIKIQRLRYGEKFSVEYDIDPGVLSEMIPKLILQPLVENAIFHGIEPSSKPGKIQIRIRGNGSTISIWVSDNGVGMDDYTFKRALSDSKRKFNRIGLENVDERLKILFGPRFGLTLRRNDGGGTTVRITIPRGEELL